MHTYLRRLSMYMYMYIYVETIENYTHIFAQIVYVYVYVYAYIRRDYRELYTRICAKSRIPLYSLVSQSDLTSGSVWLIAFCQCAYTNMPHGSSSQI